MGYYVLSFLATGALTGYHTVWPGATVDIQMHNTYFVLTWWLALLPLFLAAAVPATWVRAAQAAWRQRATNAVLAGLALPTLLLLLLLGFWTWQGLHRH